MPFGKWNGHLVQSWYWQFDYIVVHFWTLNMAHSTLKKVNSKTFKQILFALLFTVV